MTDEPQPDFSLLARRAEQAASEAQVAVEAMGRLFDAIANRFDAIEERLSSLERRQSGLEASLARSYVLTHGHPRAVTRRDDEPMLVQP